jgi:Immunity protein 42
MSEPKHVIFGDKSIFAIECEIDDTEYFIGYCCFHFPNGTLSDVTRWDYMWTVASALVGIPSSFDWRKDIGLAALPAQEAFEKIAMGFSYPEEMTNEDIWVNSFWYSRFEWLTGPLFDGYSAYVLADPRGYRFLWKNYGEETVIESIVFEKLFDRTVYEFVAWFSIYSGKDMKFNGYEYEKIYNNTLAQINKAKNQELRKQKIHNKELKKQYKSSKNVQ